jgi:hypothetical protein
MSRHSLSAIAVAEGPAVRGHQKSCCQGHVAPNPDQQPPHCVDRTKRGVRCNDPLSMPVTAIRQHVRVVTLQNARFPTPSGAPNSQTFAGPSDRRPPFNFANEMPAAVAKPEPRTNICALACSTMPSTRSMAAAAVIGQKRRHCFFLFCAPCTRLIARAQTEGSADG